MAEKKQRRGRPVTGHERITVSITPEQRKWLDGTAEHRGWDISQIVREILKQAMGGCQVSDCFRRKERKARKQHKCGECRRVIEKGELYTYCSGNHDGDPFSFKTCADCMSMRFLADDECALGELFEDVYWYIDDVNGDIPESTLIRLTPRAKEVILGLAAKFKGGTK